MRAVIRPLLLGAVAAMLAVYGYRVLMPDDEAQIRAVLDRVAVALSAPSGGGGDIERRARIAGAAGDLAPDVSIEGGHPAESLRGREAVIAAAGRVAGAIADLQLQFVDTEVGFARDRGQAYAHVTAEARFAAAGPGGIDARELDLLFRKVNGRWVLTTVLPVETMVPVK